LTLVASKQAGKFPSGEFGGALLYPTNFVTARARLLIARFVRQEQLPNGREGIKPEGWCDDARVHDRVNSRHVAPPKSNTLRKRERVKLLT